MLLLLYVLLLHNYNRNVTFLLLPLLSLFLLSLFCNALPWFMSKLFLPLLSLVWVDYCSDFLVNNNNSSNLLLYFTLPSVIVVVDFVFLLISFVLADLLLPFRLSDRVAYCAIFPIFFPLLDYCCDILWWLLAGG